MILFNRRLLELILRFGEVFEVQKKNGEATIHTATTTYPCCVPASSIGAGCVRTCRRKR
jgi:hypothetical protein